MAVRCKYHCPSQNWLWMLSCPVSSQAKMSAAGEGEWIPEGEWEGEEEESDEEEDEGVFEGKNAIASLGNQSDADAMDTIARTAHHPYYLRSLHQSGSYPGPKAPLSAAVVPRPLPTSCLPAQSYDIPTPTLPSPPPPKGDTAGDYYDALHARDLDIRKGRFRKTIQFHHMYFLTYMYLVEQAKGCMGALMKYSTSITVP